MISKKSQSVFLDESFMIRALCLAEHGRGRTSPNPVVGACITRNDKIISEGYHQFFGGPHAEIEALRKTGKKSAGATLYVTLEPCSTYGKTPPCTDAIIQAKIKRVVIGALDPNPKHSGRGVQVLKKAGIHVTTGVLGEECSRANEGFFKWIRTGRPFVTLKMAQSLDGKIALASGKSKWITSEASRREVQNMRRRVDAVLVGKRTVLLDNPSLTVRGEKDSRNLYRIILDTNVSIPASKKIFKDGGPTILVCSNKAAKRALKKFSNVNVLILPLALKKGEIDLRRLVEGLGNFGITSVLVEGGGETAWSFLSGGLVDKIAWFVAPKLIGGRKSVTSLEGDGIISLEDAYRVQDFCVRMLGDDLLIEGYLKAVK